jgi:phage repressor protein C with HTH and peptisase S24 domain
METLSERMKRRLAATGKSARRASLEAGLSASFIHNVLAGKARSPSAENLARLAAVFGSPELWLLRGEGPEDLLSSESSESFDLNNETQMRVVPEVAAREYRRLRTAAAVSRRSRTLTGTGWEIPLSFLRDELSATPGHIALLQVADDTMRPTLTPGDRVLVDFAESSPATGIFLIHDGSEAVFRRLEVIPGSAPLRLRITADNLQEAAHELPATSVAVIAKALWRGGRL